jgi:cysteine desulfurase
MKQIYLDNNATTQVAPEVLEAMIPYFSDLYGNASSVHAFGRDAKVGLENSRETCAEILEAESAEIVFCSGGTEADNLCLKGAARALKAKRNRIVISPTEHSAILQSADQLALEGFEIQFAPVSSEGIVTGEALATVVDDNTSIVSIMQANNEIGTAQNIPELVEIAHAKGALFHTDAVQAFGKVPVSVETLGVDMLSLSAHKIYGPKGVGLAFVRGGVKIESLVQGGTHEKSRRPGTENVPAIVGMAKAMELSVGMVSSEYARLNNLSGAFLERVRQSIPDVTLNGPEFGTSEMPAQPLRTPQTVNLSFAGAEGEAIILSLDLEGIAVSSGSACSSGAVDPSAVLLAIGQTPELAKSSIRFSLGRHTTSEDINHVCDVLSAIIERLRSMSPAYAKAKR